MNLILTEAAEALRSAQKLVLTAHENPDGDAIGSTLGLMHVLRDMGKEVRVFIDDDIPSNFSILPGVDQIERPTEKMTADLLVVLDTVPDRIGRTGELTDAPILNIDHHISNDGEGRRLYLDAARAATCEIVYELAKELRVPFTKESAMCIYTGIAMDCGFFSFANTKPFTMRAAAELMEYGVEPNIISEAMEQKTYTVVKAMSKALDTMEIFHGGQAVGLFLDEGLSAEIESTEGFIDMVRVIEGVDVALLLKCKEKDVCRASMRSKGTDVSKIATSFGGGGHIRAAGCTLNMPFAQAKAAIIDAINRAMDGEQQG